MCSTLTACDALPATRPVDPPLGAVQKFAVALAVVLVVATAAALALWRLRAPDTSTDAGHSAAARLGAAVLVVTGVAISLALVVHIASAIRVSDIGCDPPPEVVPETILQLRCSPLDQRAELTVVAAIAVLPIVAACFGAAWLVLRSFALEWLALAAAMLAGASLTLAFGGTAHGDARTAALATSVLFVIATVAMGIAATQRGGSSSPESSGTTMSQRSRQSAQR
jgi:hypothetical protein